MIRVDNSTLRATARCTTETATRYALGYTTPGESGPLVAGKAIHAGLDQWMSTGAKLDLAHINAAVKALHKVYGESNVEIDDERLTAQNVERILRKYITERGPSLPWVVGGPGVVFETQLTAKLTDGVEFVALVDGLVRNKTDGLWYVLENKSTRSITSYWMAQWTTAAQVTGYVWTASEYLTETQPVKTRAVGAFINAIEVQTEPKNLTYKCRTHGVKYAECKDQHAKSEVRVVSRTERQVEAWKVSALKLARRFERIKAEYRDIQSVSDRAPQEGLFHGACMFCQFKDWCALGRPANTPMLVHQPWDVIQGEGVE